MWWLLQEILGEIAGSAIVAWFKRMFGRHNAVESEMVQEYIGPNVTLEDLILLYDTVRKIVERKNKLAEEVSKSSWERYKVYFSKREHYEQLVKEKGEKEAVFWELILGLTNPLLEDRMDSDTSLTSLTTKKNKLIGKIMNVKLSQKIELLLRLQDEGQRNWIDDVVLGLDRNTNSQIVKRHYDRLVSNQLHFVMDNINQLQRMANNRDSGR